MKPRSLSSLRAFGLLTASLAGLALPAAHAQSFYHLQSAQVIPSATPPDWDYLAFDAAKSYLYIARRADGILIYDAKAEKIVGSIENSSGGNATALVPEFDRGYVINTDGSSTIFQLSTLKTLERVKLGESADNGFYDPVSKQLLVTMGDSQEAAFLDAKTGKLLGKLHIDSEKIEGAAADGKGGFWVALRDRNKVVRVDAAQRKITAEWRTEGCELPNGLAFDVAHQRVLVGCRGSNPVMAVMDAATGKVQSTTPIGRGIDILIFDADARRVYTSNGIDGNLVILDQVGADEYKLVEATSTRPFARTMALDPVSKKVYLVTAEGTVDPSKKWSKSVSPFYPNKYFENTFTLLTYVRR